MRAPEEEPARELEASSSSLPLARKLSVTICRPRKNYKHDKSTQTVYRESEAQTLPWSPEVVFRRRKDGARIPLELLGVLGEGPLGMDDLILIERARQKHTWENTLPRTSSKKNNVIRLSCISSIVVNEASFRERCLTAESEERLRLSKKSMEKDREDVLSRLEDRLRILREEKSRENAEVLEYRKRQLRRKLRKLTFDGRTGKEEGEFGKRSPRIFYNAIRSGRARRDETGLSRYLAQFGGVELLEKQIALSSRKRFQPKKIPQLKNICSRAVKKAEKEFEKLGTAKETVEEERAPGSSVRRRIRYPCGGRTSEEVARMEKEEEMDQVSLVLGKIIKGRAVQTRLFSDLIELRSRKSKPSPLIKGVYKTAPTKAANAKGPSSFVILGEMLSTPVQSRPASPSGRVSPFRGHGFKSPAVSRAPSPSQAKPKAAKPEVPKRAPPKPPKFKTDIGLPPKSPKKLRTPLRPARNPLVQKTNLVDRPRPSRTPRPNRKPLAVANNKRNDKTAPAKEGTKTVGTRQQTDLNKVSEVLSNLTADVAEEGTGVEKSEEVAAEEVVADEKSDPVEEVDVNAQVPEPEEKKEEPSAEEGTVTPAVEESVAEEAKPVLEKKESEKLIPCYQPDKCHIAPPTMASPSPIITAAINAPSTLTKAAESIATTHTSTVTTSSLNAISSAVTITGNLAKKSQSHRELVPDQATSITPNEEERQAQAPSDDPVAEKTTPSPEDASSKMPPHFQLSGTANQAKNESVNSVHGDVISTSNLIKIGSEMELLSANSLRESPPRRQPNPAWNEERLINGGVPSTATENRSKFRRLLSSIWHVIKYILCCRCIVDRCRRAACCRCDSKCCRRERDSKKPRESIFGRCCSRLNCCGRSNCCGKINCCGKSNCCSRSSCCKCKKPKCCEGLRCCKGNPKPPPKGRKCCAKPNLSCKDCCSKMKNSCSNCGERVNNFCRAIFCLNMFCCQRCLRKCCKPCHKMSCCQAGACCSCFNPGARRPPKLDKRASTQSKSEKENLDPVLVEHISLMKAAIPVLPTCLAMLCLILNLVFPGSGTLMSGIFCLCFGKPRFSVKDTAKNRVGSFCVNLVIGIAQLFTIVFCLVGWGWSIWWGVIMYRLARKRRRIKLAEKSTQEANSAANHNHVDVEKG